MSSTITPRLGENPHRGDSAGVARSKPVVGCVQIDNYLDASKELAHRMAVIARRAVLRMPLLTFGTLALIWRDICQVGCVICRIGVVWWWVWSAGLVAVRQAVRDARSD